MKKIISLFKRDYEGTHLVYDEVVPGAEWVLQGEGIATRKWDGTCAKIESGTLYKRFDSKQGKTPPAGFIAAQDPDPVTGHWPGWLTVGDGPEDKWFREAIDNCGDLPDGTYELVGPKVQGNPEQFEEHELVRHGTQVLDAPRAFDELKAWFADKDIEGVVWHRPNGDMVKIKKKDFGLKR
ncbi:hypothetical protein RR21198_4862 [Rhodococcus rhodochrous ATCC 21198]|uniref:RNA ligase 1 family protein n=1 Tax=Rhodococcus aetherivorans TaxID=191292 RepID=UPI0003E2576F|nr:DUF5565 family protein [Rhodococcus aetherivorans]ETT24266.1 hypothetical protein RR21198_4862 [Rhodococcus rhodochrous ATCC 21198]MDV6295221.1 DUF5565 family protein [Rhodococcus aetherivorans]NGP28024.1 hypothetical protein [Rhodococcus aetherivorans]